MHIVKKIYYCLAFRGGLKIFKVLRLHLLTPGLGACAEFYCSLHAFVYVKVVTKFVLNSMYRIRLPLLRDQAGKTKDFTKINEKRT